jgi:carbohydrate diacid regulator
MSNEISQETAQQIVNAVKDVCGYDINYILPDGTVQASTDPSRIGNYHEAGHQAALNGEAVEVNASDSYSGTKAGTNLPFRYHGEITTVIGITGKPDEVRKYANLAQVIVRLILRERDHGELRQTRKAEERYVINTLLQKEHIDHAYLVDFMERYRMNPEKDCRLFLIRFQIRQPDGDINTIEQKIQAEIGGLAHAFSAFSFPNSYLLVTEDERSEDVTARLNAFLKVHPDVRISAGCACPIMTLSHAYETARIALRNAGEQVSLFDELGIELLEADLHAETKAQFVSRTLNGLKEEDLSLLQIYFDHDMSLKDTAQALFIHKNTLQYRLMRIHENNGLDPRKFKDAYILCTALKLRDSLSE